MTARNDMAQNELAHEEAEAMNAVLSFYASELTSHSAVAITFGIAFLTLVQVRLNLMSPLPQALLGLMVAMTVVIGGGIYSILRVSVYGAMENTILIGSLPEFNDFLSGHNDPRRLPPSRVNMYAIDAFYKRYPKLRHFYNYKSYLTWIIIPISSVISYLLLYVILAGQ